MGALDVVADAADMAMDEGETNMTSWTKARQELGDLRSRVAANTQTIEVRQSYEPLGIPMSHRANASPVVVVAGAASPAGGP